MKTMRMMRKKRSQTTKLSMKGYGDIVEQQHRTRRSSWQKQARGSPQTEASCTDLCLQANSVLKGNDRTRFEKISALLTSA